MDIDLERSLVAVCTDILKLSATDDGSTTIGDFKRVHAKLDAFVNDNAEALTPDVLAEFKDRLRGIEEMIKQLRETRAV